MAESKPATPAAPVPFVEDRAGGKEIVNLMVSLPLEHLQEVWKGMSKQDRLRLFGHGHAEELDNLIKSLGKRNTDHLTGDEFGERLAALHLGEGMDDHRAARVLHTASGVRMAHRACEGPGKCGKEAHASTMRILNARYKQK